ncbi:MAG: Lrp/AsnC family transcriptional regulator [Candidatus Woesearchaeota archaeon]
MNEEKELQLMAVLRENARMPLTKISKTTNIPVSTIFDTLRTLQKGAISKFTCLLDFRKLGYDVRIHLFFRVPSDKRDEFQEFLRRHPRINTVYRINNGYDFFVEAVFKDVTEYQVFNESLDKQPILERREHFVLEDVKREDFLAGKNALSIG